MRFKIITPRTSCEGAGQERGETRRLGPLTNQLGHQPLRLRIAAALEAPRRLAVTNEIVRRKLDLDGSFQALNDRIRRNVDVRVDEDAENHAPLRGIMTLHLEVHLHEHRTELEFTPWDEGQARADHLEREHNTSAELDLGHEKLLSKEAHGRAAHTNAVKALDILYS